MIAQQVQQLLMTWSQRQLCRAGSPAPNRLDTQPRALQRLPQSFGAILQPSAQVAARTAHGVKLDVIVRAIFPVKLVHRKKVMCVKAPAIQRPQRQRSDVVEFALRQLTSNDLPGKTALPTY